MTGSERRRVLALLLETADRDKVVHALLSCVGRHPDLPGLLPHLGADLGETRRRVFGRSADRLGALSVALHFLREDTSAPGYLSFFAFSLSRVDDPFYRRVGEILAREIAGDAPAQARVDADRHLSA
jgi:hypothetical protein